MEINGSTGRPPIDTGEASQSADKVNTPAAEPAKDRASAASADTFSLTNKASQLQQLESQIASLPVVDTQRVKDVQHALATGSLEVEPGQVADKLLSFETGLAEPSEQ